VEVVEEGDKKTMMPEDQRIVVDLREWNPLEVNRAVIEMKSIVLATPKVQYCLLILKITRVSK